MSNLETKATKITMVIRKNEEIEARLINSFCEEHLSRYAWIEHKSDISTDTMEIEGIHYHIVGQLKARTRIGTLLNRVVLHFGFNNPYGIEIACASCIEGCYQYLIHKNDKDKTPHDISEVITNIPLDEFKTLMEIDFTDNTITQARIDTLVDDNIIFDEVKLKVRINYRAIAQGIGATRCNCVSWALNNSIKQRVYELCNLHDVPIPDKF